MLQRLDLCISLLNLKKLALSLLPSLLLIIDFGVKTPKFSLEEFNRIPKFISYLINEFDLKELLSLNQYLRRMLTS